MHRANAYAALVEALSRWSKLPVTELVGRVNKPAEVTEVTIQGEILTIELAASWADEKKLSVRIEAIANVVAPFALREQVAALGAAPSPMPGISDSAQH